MKNTDIFQAAINQFPEPLFILNEDRECSYANGAFYRFFGLSADANGALSIQDFWPEVQKAKLTSSELTCELHLRRGETFAVKLALAQLPNRYTLVRVVAGLSKKESQQTFQTQRLETLGLLAGGIAHDFNNMLAGILGHITFLKTILPGKGNHVESLKAIEDGARKATSMTQQILNFSRLESTEKSEPVNLCELVKSTTSLIRGAVSAEISVEYDVPRSALFILGVEGKLAQVIVNLAVNARDALHSNENPRIEIKLQDVTKSAELEQAFSGQELPCSHYACLKVKDNGHGMSREVMERIFEPYFSTKDRRGTGLGLTTVASIVQQLGGTISVKSETKVGTEIRVYLPMVEIGSDAREPKAQDPRLETGSERILVVDDEYPVRNVLSISLQHLGYEVETAASGIEALEKYSEANHVFDLIILDMLMPKLSGEKVFFKMKELNPGVRVLLISGFSSEEVVRNILKNGGMDFIQKPFTIEELSRRVRGCLDR